MLYFNHCEPSLIPFTTEHFCRLMKKCIIRYKIRKRCRGLNNMWMHHIWTYRRPVSRYKKITIRPIYWDFFCLFFCQSTLLLVQKKLGKTLISNGVSSVHIYRYHRLVVYTTSVIYGLMVSVLKFWRWVTHGVTLLSCQRYKLLWTKAVILVCLVVYSINNFNVLWTGELFILSSLM